MVISTHVINNASHFVGVCEKWWRDAVAHTRSEQLCHGLSVTIKRAERQLVINGGAFLKLIGAGMQDRISPASSTGQFCDTFHYVFVCESLRKTVAGWEIDIKIGARCFTGWLCLCGMRDGAMYTCSHTQHRIVETTIILVKFASQMRSKLKLMIFIWITNS